MKKYFKQLVMMFALLLQANYVFAADSYRYMHVSIDTPWAIFIFLLFIILFPFVLSAILYWYFTFKKNKQEAQQQENASSAVEEEQS